VMNEFSPCAVVYMLQGMTADQFKASELLML
jgi:hypothetical protein